MTRVIAPKYDPTRRCRPVAEWPEVDRRAWNAALVKGDVLDPGGAASRWAPLTQRGAAKGYGRLLTWLDSVGGLAATSLAAEPITPQHVRAFIAALALVNAPMTVLHRVEALARVAGALAPDREWGWLWRVAGRLRRKVVSSRDKHSRLVEAGELFGLGQRLMAEADGDALQGRAGSPWRRAVRYRDGLMVALLALRPLRLQNLVDIELGRQLVAQHDGYRLHFTAAETKTRRVLDQPFPEVLLPALERYLTQHRPVLCARSCFQRGSVPDAAIRSLWVGNTGVGVSAVNTYARIMDLTGQAFRHPVNPHLFRDCAATSIAIDMPSQVHIVMGVLGHASLSTSERHYNHANSVQAARLHQAHIMALRREAQKSREPARRRDK